MVNKTKSSPTKTKSSGGVLKALQKKYEGLQVVTSETDKFIVDVIRTGSLSMDIALGVGGIARGTIFEISGDNSTGKTTRSLNVAANAQELGYRVAFIDTEYALDREWAQKLGVKISKSGNFEDGMVIINVENLEEAGEAAVMLAASGEVDVIILDSVAGAPIEAVVEGDLGDANMGVRARIMSQFMPKLNGPVKRNNVWMIFTNQIRLTMNQYDPYVTPGGKALPFHASQRVFLTSAKKEKTQPGVAPKYSTVSFTIQKNKLAPPFRRGEFNMQYEDGSVDIYQELADVLTSGENLEKLGIIRTGAWYTLPQELLAEGYQPKMNGSAQVVEMLSSDLDHFKKVVEYVREKLIKNGDEGSRRHNASTSASSALDIEEEEEE